MSEAKIVDRVIKIISEQLDIDEGKQITEQTSIVGDLGADSLEVIEMVMKLEEEFGIEISEEESRKINTVGDVVKALVDKGVKEE